MDMALLQFYRNPYSYPRYGSLIAYGSPMDCTPVGVNLRSGTIRVKGEFEDFMSCNYLALTRDNKTIYAWIDDVRFRTEDSFEVSYTVDAWRTYKGKITLGTQFIARSTFETNLHDTLLGSTQPYVDVESLLVQRPDNTKRIMVVQVRGKAGSVYSNTPVQPTPYLFYMTPFNINSWQDSTPLRQLINCFGDNAETQNIVTMYSIPYMDISGLPTNPLLVETAAGSTTVDGFKCLDGTTDASGLLYNEMTLPVPTDTAILRTEHTVQVVIPEAGILNIPDEILFNPNLKLRQDIDLFSGASNYMLTTGSTEYYTQSVRGSSISSIPIISDPMDTYLSQNQNALATSLIGDVASIAMGAGLLATTGGIGAALGGTASISGGINGLMNTAANVGDAGNHYSNPPAFLGTALAANFNQSFWLITRRLKVDNADDVHTNFGYPYNKVGALSFPVSGYIQTKSCNVYSDGSVPKWALDEINTRFDNGILVK